MRHARCGLLLCLLLAAGAAGAAEKSTPSEPTLNFGRFGTVTLYQQSPQPRHVVLFVSGDGGWNLGVVDMARELSTLDALVVGINITTYLKNLASSSESCSYPAADFESLSQYLQKKLNRPVYATPMLVGYSSGATLVYALLVQAPPGTFKGAISMGFCPDLPIRKPFCRGSGLVGRPSTDGKSYLFDPVPRLEIPWVALQGDVDQVCDAAATESFVKQVGGAELVALPKVGHGFSVPKNWLPQLKESFSQLVAKTGDAAEPATPAAAEPPAASDGTATVESVKDLPMIEVVPKGERAATMAVMLSGDGGWAGMDREVSKVLTARGIPVAGVSSLQYFWTRRTPETASKDLERIVRHYMAAWKCDKVLLLGYSRGADVLPFMANRLPADLMSHVALVGLIGPAHTVDFEFHLSDWLTGGDRDTALPILPETAKLKDMKLVCFYGADENDSLCPDLPAGTATVVKMGGGHHFGGNYSDIGDRILQEAGGAAPAAQGSR